MENSDLVVPANSRIDDSPVNDTFQAKISPPPPKSSPVSSVSFRSLTSRIKREDNKTVEFEEIQRENSASSSIEEEKQVADILKSRLYDSAESSDVFNRIRLQVRLLPLFFTKLLF